MPLIGLAGFVIGGRGLVCLAIRCQGLRRLALALSHCDFISGIRFASSSKSATLRASHSPLRRAGGERAVAENP